MIDENIKKIYIYVLKGRYKIQNSVGKSSFYLINGWNIKTMFWIDLK